MTEKSWVRGAKAQPIVEFACSTASNRKLRLFACACARRVWHMLGDERSRRAVEVAEQYADGRADNSQLPLAFEDSCEANRDVRSTPPQREADDMASCVARAAVWPDEDLRISPTGDEFSGVVDALCCTLTAVECAASDAARDSALAKRAEEKVLANIARDIFGNPFRAVTFSASWRTDTALSLARQMYDSRDFGAMPILADALQEAGCDSAEVFDHCRGPGPHVRGCWVVDMVLGKE